LIDRSFQICFSVLMQSMSVTFVDSTERNAETKPFPVLTNRACNIVQGSRTELILQSFSDVIFVIITQTNKLGTFIEATKELGDALESSEADAFSTRILLGRRDQPLLTIYARQLIELISSAGDKRSLLLAISLSPKSGTSMEIRSSSSSHDKATFQEIFSLIKANRVW